MIDPASLSNIISGIGVTLLGYVTSRVMGTADRLDKIAIELAEIKGFIQSHSAALDRGQQKFDNHEERIRNLEISIGRRA